MDKDTIKCPHCGKDMKLKEINEGFIFKKIQKQEAYICTKCPLMLFKSSVIEMNRIKEGRLYPWELERQEICKNTPEAWSTPSNL